MISSLDLSELCPPDELRKRMISLAILDAIMSPEWQYRYYSYDPRWRKDVTLASMRNGSGDDFFILFAPEGCVIKGFAHESSMSPYRLRRNIPHARGIWPGIYDAVPADLYQLIDNPALTLDDVTYCIWWHNSVPEWRMGVSDFPLEDDPDGSEGHLQILDGDPATYQEYARQYYERETPIAVIRAIYAHYPVSKEAIQALDPSANVERIFMDMRAYGYESRV
ncbi:MAG: hypothetical protein ABI690_16330 [Chloroflexota bacterium]